MPGLWQKPCASRLETRSKPGPWRETSGAKFWTNLRGDVPTGCMRAFVGLFSDIGFECINDPETHVAIELNDCGATWLYPLTRSSVLAPWTETYGTPMSGITQTPASFIGSVGAKSFTGPTLTPPTI